MIDMFSRWRDGLSKTSKAAFGQIATLLGATEITLETWDDLEALLIQSDMGLATTASILENLKRITRDRGLTRADELTAALKEDLLTRLDAPPALQLDHHPSVILVVGVNGS